MVQINWRTVHYISYIATLLFALEPSYIHPDEHFQSFEVITSQVYGWSTNVPWEFKGEPSRSHTLLYLIYGPVVYLNKWLNFTPISLLYLTRLQFVFSYFIVLQITTRILLKSKQETTKALFFLYTSYVTWCYQSHTFSNSIETQLLLIALSLIQITREIHNTTKDNPLYRVQFILGIVLSLGIFNRITFFAFLILPSLFLLRHYKKYILSGALALTSFSITSFLIVTFDTKLSGSEKYIVTPLKSLLYNAKTDNLALHGLHPRYTHLLINLPQIIGPLLIPLIFRNHHKNSIPYLSLVSGISVLSIVPHQELRFLTPLFPLVTFCIDFTNFTNPRTVEWITRAWCIFNLIFGIIMGSLHQRGVITALDHLRAINYQGPHIWWKTYSPPTWILGSKSLQFDVIGENSVVDLMGSSTDDLVSTIKVWNESLLITPRSSVPLLDPLSDTVLFTKIWSSNFNLDLDHFDFNDLRTFEPGIDIYRVSIYKED